MTKQVIQIPIPQTLRPPCYSIAIYHENAYCYKLDFITDTSRMASTPAWCTSHDPIYQAMHHYLCDPQHMPNVNMAPAMTRFQQQLRNVLTKIPPGCPITYSELAKRLQSHPRAVAAACRANPLPVIVPCHRVIGNNHLGGYMGQTSGTGYDIKRWLLQHEGYQR